MLIIIVASIVVLLIFFIKSSNIERNLLLSESITIESDKIKAPFRIIFLADLHDKEFGEGNEGLVKAVTDANPDYILLGGDTMNVRKRKIGLRVTEKLLQDLSSIAPIYYANGNNEQRMTWQAGEFGSYYLQFCEILKKYGVHYLENSYADIEKGTRISGLDLEPAHYRLLFYKHLTKTYIDEHIGFADPDKFNILLCHSPSFLDACADWGADLVLSGHAHGGIIRFPTDRNKQPGKIDNDRGLISSQLRLFHKYCAGVFWKDRTCMIVSRGLGTHTVNVRINNKPQIVVINIEPN